MQLSEKVGTLVLPKHKTQQNKQANNKKQTHNSLNICNFYAFMYQLNLKIRHKWLIDIQDNIPSY